MKPIKLLILTTLMSALLAFFCLSFLKQEPSEPSSNTLQTVLNRGSIRVGYVVNPPSLIKDPNSGKLSGIYYEATELLGKKLNLNIDWVEETGWSTMIEGLHAKRYDMVVGGIWPSAARSKRANFSIPLYFSVVTAYCRPTDTRFNTLTDINKPSVTIAVVDGETSSIIAATSFPNAKIISLPQDTPLSHLLLNVKTNKADITFVEKIIASDFLKQNPNSVKDCFPTRPIRSFGNTILFAKGQHDFEVMINTALLDIINSGEAETLITRYETAPDAFYRPSTTYIARSGH